MTAHCTVCNHPERSRIDVALARGQPATKVAKRFGLPHPNVSRHRRVGHIPANILAAFPKNGAPALSSEELGDLRTNESAAILLNLAQQRGRLLQLQDRAEKGRKSQLILACAKRIHENIALVARTVGEFAQHERAITEVSHISILLSPEYITLRNELVKAVRPFPEARRAIAAVLEELEGGPVHFTGVKSTPKLIEAQAEPADA